MVTNTAARAVFLFRETSEWLLLTPKFYYFTGNEAYFTLDSQSASQPASRSVRQKHKHLNPIVIFAFSQFQ